MKSRSRKELLNRAIDDLKVLDALWADYMKHKDDLAIRRIVSVLQWEKDGSGMAIVIGGAARWSLGSQARTYPHVRKVCEQLVDGENDTTKKILEAIIEGASELKGE